MSFVAIDPGIHTGWAEFLYATGGDHVSRLYHCGLGDPRETFAHMTPSEVVIEKPQAYTAARSKGDPNDLITLAIRVGEYKEFFQSRKAQVTLVVPFAWKKQLPKKVMQRRILPILSKYELEIAQAAVANLGEHEHDVWDAIGLGLAYCRRWRA